jgi:H+/Cl- antiporter ClcA
MTTTENELRGLGGWLILPAIGLIIMPLRLMLLIKSDFLPLFQNGSWEVLTTPGTEAYHPLWAPLILFELIGNSIFILFDIFLIFLFFSKSYRFPSLYIIFLATNLIFIVGDLFLCNLIPALASESNSEAIREVTRSIVGALIWIPYFLVSKRVKNTFVKPEPNNSFKADASGCA